MVVVMLFRLTLQELFCCTDKGSLKWWSLIRWAVLLLVAVVLVDAKRGRCYASRAALVAQSPVWQGESDILLDDDLSEFLDAASPVRREDVVPDVSWLADKDKDAVRHRGKRAAAARKRVSAVRREAVVWFVNLVERYNVSMQLIGPYGTLQFGGLHYGQTRRRIASVSLEDIIYVAENGPDGKQLLYTVYRSMCQLGTPFVRMTLALCHESSACVLRIVPRLHAQRAGA